MSERQLTPDTNKEAVLDASWARQKLDGVQIARTRLPEQSIDLTDLKNVVFRLPHPEILLDVVACFKNTPAEEIAILYREVLQQFGTSNVQTTANNPRDQIKAFITNLLKFAVKGRPWRDSTNDPANDTFIEMISPALNVKTTLKEQNATPDLKILAEALPIIKAINHAFVSHVFCISNQPIWTSDANKTLKETRAVTGEYDIVGQLESLVLHLAGKPDDLNDEQEAEVDKLKTRLVNLKSRYPVQVPKVCSVKPRIETPTVYFSFSDSEILTVTLTLLEDQISFLERTVETSIAKVQDDLEENETIIRLQDEKELQNLIQEAQDLKNKVDHLQVQAVRSEVLIDQYQKPLQDCESIFKECIRKILSVDYPHGLFVRDKDTKYRTSIEEVLKQYRDSFLKTGKYGATLALQVKGVTDKSIDPDTSNVGTTDEEGFVQDKKRLKERISTLSTTCRQTEKKVEQFEAKIAEYLGKLNNWSELFERLNNIVADLPPNQTIRNIVGGLEERAREKDLI